MPPQASRTLDSSSPVPQEIRVLTLDGGGFRGLGMLLVLQEISKQANLRNREPSDPQLRPHEIFDVVAGSSTGGLVAVLLGRLRLDCETAINEYKTLATALFGTSRAEFVKTVLAGKKLDNVSIERYDKAVDDLIEKYSSQTTPSFYVNPHEDNQTIVVIQQSGRNIPQLVPSFGASDSNTWTIKDVIRATTAASRYIPSYQPPGDKWAYMDAAYGGKGINPTALVEKHLRGDTIAVLVNIGQGFSAIDLPNRGTLIKADTRPFKGDFLGGVPEHPKTEDTILVYLKQAKAVQDALRDIEGGSSRSARVSKRVDPTLGGKAQILELVDIFYEDDIRRTVKQWSLDSASLITEITTALVKPDSATPEPIPDVRPYNVALNAKKPREMLPYFNTYHVVFIIDDSTSMIMTDNYEAWHDGRWNQAQGSIGPIADFTFRNGVTTVDIGFMHHRRTNPFRGVQNQEAVLQIFRQAKPPASLSHIQRTPTGAVLKFFIDEALQELDSKKDNPELYKNIRPTDIILLTDGEADDDPGAVIHAAGQRMKENRHNPNYIGIQVVQIGRSPLLKLQDIAKGDYGSMADIVMSDGTDLTPEKLTRIMLGGNHPTVRKKLQAQDLL